MRVLAVGEILWDVFPDKGEEFLGGAPLNVSVHLARLGAEVQLLSAVGDDARGEQALRSLREHSVSTELVLTTREAATGTAVVSHSPEGAVEFTIVRPAAYDFARLPEHAPAVAPNWVYYGTLAQAGPARDALLQAALAHTPHARRFYDVNLREENWDFALVKELSQHSSAAKLNEDEAQVLFRLLAPGTAFTLERFCQVWAERFALQLLCVTRGAEGCVLYAEGRMHTFAAYPVQVVDTVGAGDAFVAALLHGLGSGWPLERTGRFANALAAIVASRPGATPHWTLAECQALAAQD
jgi:fructokinase